jgi:hypothetical protein
MAAREKDKNERWVWQDPDGDIRCTVFIFLEEANTSKGAFWWSMLMQLLIFISSVIFVVETLENVKTNVEAKKDMAVRLRQYPIACHHRLVSDGAAPADYRMGLRNSVHGRVLGPPRRVHGAAV